MLNIDPSFSVLWSSSQLKYDRCETKAFTLSACYINTVAFGRMQNVCYISLFADICLPLWVWNISSLSSANTDFYEVGLSLSEICFACFTSHLKLTKSIFLYFTDSFCLYLLNDLITLRMWVYNLLWMVFHVVMYVEGSYMQLYDKKKNNGLVHGFVFWFTEISLNIIAVSHGTAAHDAPQRNTSLL